MTSYTHSAKHEAMGGKAPLPDEPCTIFLIEDNFDDRLLAKKELGASEHVRDIKCFSDGEELIAYMQENGFMNKSVMMMNPMLILVDLEMPKKDGLEILEELKSNTFLQDIPMVVISGTTSDSKRKKAYELGADGVFAKPLKAKMLNDYYQSAWKWPPNQMWMQ
ncbi:MAG: response regulator [Pseudobdellovibrionaceae bacterium]